MKKTETILTSLDGNIATITLNRPGVHHAMNIEMIRELTRFISGPCENPDIRIILLRATGENFSAGADLNWLRDGMDQDEEQLKRESMELAGLFRLISKTPRIFVTAVQGKILGGANGLVAASDLVLAERSATFSFPEVKLGLVPATITPFMVRKVGRSRAAAWMISGKIFDSEEALAGGLVHLVCQDGQLGEETGKLMDTLLANGPEAMKGIKEMLNNFNFDRDAGTIQEESADLIARYRISPEGQEGMKAFFKMRKPGWHGGA